MDRRPRDWERNRGPAQSDDMGRFWFEDGDRTKTHVILCAGCDGALVAMRPDAGGGCEVTPRFLDRLGA